MPDLPTETSPTQAADPAAAAAVSAPPSTAADAAALPPAGSVADPAPIDYSKLTTPEALKPDASLVDALRGLATEHKLPLAATQALVDQLATQRAASLEAERVAIEGENAAWKSANLADPEIGGVEGLARIPEVLASHGSPELTKYLESTGLINHPEIARFLAKVGKELGESPMLRMGASGGAAAQDAKYRQIYKNSPTMFTN